MAECPESIEELQELERLIPLCRKTLFDQARARIESGAACSVSEAARQIGEETGRKPETIRSMINKESRSTVYDTQLFELSGFAGTDKHRPKDTIATKWTGDQESYTPKEYVESARKVMGGIDLDPATSELGSPPGGTRKIDFEIAIFDLKYYTKNFKHPMEGEEKCHLIG